MRIPPPPFECGCVTVFGVRVVFKCCVRRGTTGGAAKDAVVNESAMLTRAANGTALDRDGATLDKVDASGFAARQLLAAQGCSWRCEIYPFFEGRENHVGKIVRIGEEIDLWVAASGAVTYNPNNGLPSVQINTGFEGWSRSHVAWWDPPGGDQYNMIGKILSVETVVNGTVKIDVSAGNYSYVR